MNGYQKFAPTLDSHCSLKNYDPANGIQPTTWGLRHLVCIASMTFQTLVYLRFKSWLKAWGFSLNLKPLHRGLLFIFRSSQKGIRTHSPTHPKNSSSSSSPENMDTNKPNRSLHFLFAGMDIIVHLVWLRPWSWEMMVWQKRQTMLSANRSPTE